MDLDDAIFLQVLQPYFEAFAEVDLSRRLHLLEKAMTPEAEIWGPQRVFAGYRDISDKVTGFHRRWPRCRLVLATGLNIFRTTARFGDAIVAVDGTVRASGHAIVELAGDGRIGRVIPYWEALPTLPPSWPLHLSAASIVPLECPR